MPQRITLPARAIPADVRELLAQAGNRDDTCNCRDCREARERIEAAHVQPRAFVEQWLDNASRAPADDPAVVDVPVYVWEPLAWSDNGRLRPWTEADDANDALIRGTETGRFRLNVNEWANVERALLAPDPVPLPAPAPGFVFVVADEASSVPPVFDGMRDSAPANESPAGEGDDIPEDDEDEEPETFGECYSCGETFYNEDDARTSEYDDYDNERCRSCHRAYESECENRDDDEDEGTGLQSYSFRPRPKFYDANLGGTVAPALPLRDSDGMQRRDTRLFIGAELEIEAPSYSGIRDGIDALTGIVDSYAKEDCSLSCDGYEWVTHPHTPNAWRALRANVETAFRRLRRAGHRSYNTTTCGLHLHMSREAFNGTAHIFKFLSLVYHNPGFIVRLSKRRRESLDTYASLNDCNIDQLPDKAQSGGTSRFGRYSAVNMQNGATIELRFFRGTLAVEGFYRALQFAEALHDWTRDESLENAASLPAFRAFVRDNAKRYPDLAAFVADPSKTDTSEQH